MADEIEVTPSEDSGNVPAETPSEQPIAENPAEKVETAQPAEPEMYELPDGRKVDGATLSKEWKENFLPEFTRKSQTLAELEKGKTINPAPTKPYESPDWQPQTWAEAIEMAKKEALQEIEAKEQAKVEQRQALENTVVTQLEEIKKADPNVNENALFLHATKYGFQDLRLAYQNMHDMSETVKKVQTTTAANIAKRNDPVSVSPGATGARPDPGQFGNAVEYLRSLK